MFAFDVALQQLAEDRSSSTADGVATGMNDRWRAVDPGGRVLIPEGQPCPLAG